MSALRSLSFKGCQTRNEVFARLTAFMNANEDEMVLSFASRLLQATAGGCR